MRVTKMEFDNLLPGVQDQYAHVKEYGLQMARSASNILERDTVVDGIARMASGLAYVERTTKAHLVSCVAMGSAVVRKKGRQGP